jgi:GMP synthase-like glutamine amidotransferase
LKPILAIEQDPTLPGLGLLGRVVRARGLPITSAHAWEGDLDGLRARDFGGIVPLGGSMQSWDE